MRSPGSTSRVFKAGRQTYTLRLIFLTWPDPVPRKANDALYMRPIISHQIQPTPTQMIMLMTLITAPTPHQAPMET